ncbi:hypothetical protein PsYK624_107200 [Phanerochaete sordida]|uniref:DUF6533 domain-containing protein n=1 Tax=Phanerochaete sordida TaxID=48140 RepID=A0A9P3GGJ2_9APHY|nr:hypothetical protein PsYK624_107200 [Phanerochaete sordida]
MSAQALQHAIHAAMESHVNKCAAYSRLALLAYDLLLNTGREVDLVWRQKWRASTAIYFFLRYPVIAFQIFNVYASAYTTPHCDALYRFTWAFSILLTRVAITASFALRIYAILDLSRIAFAIAAGLGLVGLTAIGLDIWQDIQVSCSTSSNPIHCSDILPASSVRRSHHSCPCVSIRGPCPARRDTSHERPRAYISHHQPRPSLFFHCRHRADHRYHSLLYPPGCLQPGAEQLRSSDRVNPPLPLPTRPARTARPPLSQHARRHYLSTEVQPCGGLDDRVLREGELQRRA